jgi:hypothetical protein
LEELIRQLNDPASHDVEIVKPEVWQALDATWQPPEALPPRRELTLNWLWATLWGEVVVDPTAAEIRRRATEHDQQYPESHEARYRRENPNWLTEQLAGYIEHNSWYRLCRVEQLLDASARPEDGWRLPDRQRIGWLREHEAAVRGVIEKAKAAHFKHYGGGTLRPEDRASR